MEETTKNLTTMVEVDTDLTKLGKSEVVCLGSTEAVMATDLGKLCR